MKNKNLLRAIAIVVIAALSLSFFLACEPTDDNNNYNIIGSWKCVGYANEQNNTFIDIEPQNCEMCYHLTFKTDSAIEGRSYLNTFLGDYNLNKPWISVQINFQTEIYDETGADENFINLLGNVYTYKFKNNQLWLGYENNKYLVFTQ